MQGEYLLFAEKEILERVDEYALYSHYLGYDILIGGSYSSPIREAKGLTDDLKPSFGIYERRFGHTINEFMWKDSALGIHGDIFDLIKVLFDYTSRKHAMFKVMSDFGIGGESDGRIIIPKKNLSRRYTDMTDIAVSSRPMRMTDVFYWNRFNISSSLLTEYQCTSIKQYWTFTDQKYPYYTHGLSYAYRIWDKYQLYFPGGTYKYKFLNGMNDLCVLGYLQLHYDSDLCVITKSMKDVMCLRSFGYEAVSPRSENILLPPECIDRLKKKYKRILVLFDNDMKHKGDAYEFEKVYVPKLMDTDKDTSDFCDNHGPKECSIMLQQIFAA